MSFERCAWLFGKRAIAQRALARGFSAFAVRRVNRMSHPVQRPRWRSAARALLLASVLASCRAPGPADAVAEPFPEAQKEVERTLRDLLDAAGRKDFVRLEALHLQGPKFSKWDGSGPGKLDAEANRRAERAGIEALEAFRASVEDLKVDVFGSTAVATFTMPYEAVAAGQTSRTAVRATLVWVKVDAGWKVAHEHFSPVPAKP
ncbi:MAG: nuclear transport factor 2 family protein [Planctomycetes bacterium]|nr:nuclear transport factor 2 family protein [Planctomycetota bacterium]